MTGPLLPGESAHMVRSAPSPRPSRAILPGESQAIADLAFMAYIEGLVAADSPDCDPDPFS